MQYNEPQAPADTHTAPTAMTSTRRGNRLVETGFAQLPVDTRRETYDSHREGWSRELADLVAHVDGP
jgi:hypothetical protein